MSGGGLLGEIKEFISPHITLRTHNENKDPVLTVLSLRMHASQHVCAHWVLKKLCVDAC